MRTKIETNEFHYINNSSDMFAETGEILVEFTSDINIDNFKIVYIIQTPDNKIIITENKNIALDYSEKGVNILQMINTEYHESLIRNNHNNHV